MSVMFIEEIIGCKIWGFNGGVYEDVLEELSAKFLWNVGSYKSHTA
jgi:hypothetical protein